MQRLGGEDVCNIVSTMSKLSIFNSLFLIISSLNYHHKMQRLGGETTDEKSL